MSTFPTMYRHSIFKVSPKILLVSSCFSGRCTITTAFPVTVNVLKNSKILTQYHASLLPAIQSANISTSNRTNVAKQENQSEKKDTQDKNLDSFSRYEKAAVAEDTHFHGRRKEQEEKTKALIAVKSEENSQGIFIVIIHFRLVHTYKFQLFEI